MFNEQRDTAIGKVLSPHGISGLLKVFPYTDFPERITLLKEVELVTESFRKTWRIEKGSLHGRFWLIKFEGIDNRDQAARLKDALLVIAKSERLSLPDDCYYHDQLINLAVLDRQGKRIGIVIDLITTGGHDLLLVQREASPGKVFMVPAVKKFIVAVNLSESFITVELPDGLLDL